MRFAAFLAVAPLAVHAQNNGGHNQCKCKDTPTDGTQVAINPVDKPDITYPAQQPAYGYGCAAHDSGHHTCGSRDTSDGTADDWCEDHWCIVDPSDCDFRALHVSYTDQPDDFFSYEACDLNFGTDQATFVGNGWVGRCQNCGQGNLQDNGGDRTGDDWEQSYCPCGAGGHTDCPCLYGSTTASQATGNPVYPAQVAAYGWGCAAHDSGHDTCGSRDTSDGTADDWCEDHWCRVNPSKCKFRALHISYTGQPDDFFSYEACDTNFGTILQAFAGNGWVGRCQNCGQGNLKDDGSDRTGALWQEAYCPCNGGHNDCKCLWGKTTASQATDKPKYPEEVSEYGWGCKAHDEGYASCNGTDTSAGSDDDWCADQWCRVDPNNCKFRALHISYTAHPHDFFSYEACDVNFGTAQATFMGNGWVGRCKNCAQMATGGDRTGMHWEQSFCPCNGHDDCPCLPGGAQATRATGNPAYPGQVPAYGWGCKAHDEGYDSCNGKDTTDGTADDWCADQWCRVDPSDCAFRALHISYTAQADDFFSYEACDKNFGTAQATFMGNAWVGRCKNCAQMTTGDDRTGEHWDEAFCQCGGLDICPCIEGVRVATQATGKPTYPKQQPSYGYGCKAHDSGHDTCGDGRSTADGTPDDWCEDKWCIVDPNNCNLTSIGVSYTGDANDEFAYGTCDENFAGNGWVGRCADGAGWTPCPTPAPVPTPAPSPESADVASKVVPTVIGGVLLAAVSL